MLIFCFGDAPFEKMETGVELPACQQITKSIMISIYLKAIYQKVYTKNKKQKNKIVVNKSYKMYNKFINNFALILDLNTLGFFVTKKIGKGK